MRRTHDEPAAINSRRIVANSKRLPSGRQTSDTPTRRNRPFRHHASTAQRPVRRCVLTIQKPIQNEAFVSHKLVSAILLALALLAAPAAAQTSALQTDGKRAQMIETLRAIASAPPQTQAAPPAEKPSAIPLSEDSLAAQLLESVSDQVGEVSRQVADVARTLTHFKAFYWWFIRTANDPDAYGQLLDIAWKLALVFFGAFVAEWLVFRLIKRPVAALEARMPQTANAPAPMLAM